MADGLANGRVFVANRGEIALRVIHAAHSLGLETVLGVSSADSDSVPARAAGRRLVLGPPPAKNSYLDIDLIVHAAKASGCTALHPGYGFVSERFELAQLCEEQGIAFVGPRAETIRRVGDKLSARALARSVGLPLTEGSEKIQDLADSLRIAEEIGYPVITKASAGGGGRGMIVAHCPEDLAAAFDQAQTTAREAFGDDTLYVERYIAAARHVEVQVFGDGDGSVLHFGERDCSIQRRYQKVFEEAPAAIVPDSVRARMHAAATNLLAAIGYRNAGTVEFLYDMDRQEFFFMEVNARIQVEHPVSESITGADLVRMQLQHATSVTPLMTQADITMSGHAIEVRVIAENPDDNFLPSPGRITEWIVPRGPGMRLDSAVETGTLISPYYDGMIAKLIVHGDTRQAAVARLTEALDQFVIGGITTNLDLLRFVAAHPDFRENRVGTHWLEKTLLPEFGARKVH